jgi:hypothetical protein
MKRIILSFLILALFGCRTSDTGSGREVKAVINLSGIPGDPRQTFALMADGTITFSKEKENHTSRWQSKLSPENAEYMMQAIEAAFNDISAAPRIQDWVDGTYIRIVLKDKKSREVTFDHYGPPEDKLVGVERMFDRLKKIFPDDTWW